MEQEYIITVGEYEAYYMAARIQGPADPDLDTLWQEFDATYHVIWQDIVGGIPGPTAQVDFEAIADRKLRAEGFEGYGFAELFADWLVKTKGFRVLPLIEFHVPR